MNEFMNLVHKNNVSATQYLTALLLYSIYKNDPNAKRSKKPIKIFVPVNLRRFFEVNTLRNFALYIKVSINPLEKEYTFDIKITFENNEIAKGSLSISNDSPYLRFFYKGVNHCFSKSEALSKEEFELYRSEFNAFLRDSFNNNTYPSIEEVETNELYIQYTNFNQIDPCCNGPKIYVGVNKVSIITYLEKGEIAATYNDGTIDNINIYDIENIALVKLDGTFERLEQVQEGQCFLTDNHFHLK